MAATEAAIAEQTASSNGWFQIAVPSDGSIACIKKIVGHTGNGKPVASADILKKLKDQKVTHGIDIDAIAHLLKLVETNQIPDDPVVIAGSDVQEGKGGNLQWFVAIGDDPDSEIIVAPDMQIAILRKALKGKAGRNVFGKSKQPRPIFEPQLHAGPGISVEEGADGEFVYHTNYAGELKYTDDTVSVEHHITISDDHMQAHMHIPVGKVEGVEKPIAEEDILAVIASLNITHGIQVENIRKALKENGDQPCLVKNVLVAEGRAVKDGVNALLLVDEHLSVGKMLDNGKIDFHEKSYPWNVKTGEVIGRVIPPQVEEDGFTVLGKIITAVQAEGANLVLAGIVEKASGELCAEQDGVLLVNGLNITVADSLVVKGDICHQTGNIRSDKTVIVKGYVEPGFVLESRGDIIIQSNVEQSLVRCSGSLVIKSGVRGSNSKIISRGNISASFIENGRAMAFGDIMVENSLVGCYSYCQGTLYVGKKSKKSTLVGGTTYAVKGIVAANLGSEGCNKTVVRVGAKIETLQKLKELSEELTKREQILNGLEHLYTQKKQSQMKDIDKKVEIIGNTCTAMKQELEQVKLEWDKLQAQVEISKKATVVIHQNVYPGVCIQILDKSHEVRKKENAGTFFLKDELILFRPAA